jgi:hypothetical protein
MGKRKANRDGLFAVVDKLFLLQNILGNTPVGSKDLTGLVPPLSDVLLLD